MNWFTNFLTVKAAYKRYDGYNISSATDLVGVALMLIQKEPDKMKFLIHLMLEYFSDNKRYWKTDSSGLERAIHNEKMSIIEKYESEYKKAVPAPNGNEHDEAYEDKLSEVVSDQMDNDPAFVALVEMQSSVYDRQRKDQARQREIEKRNTPWTGS